MQNEAGGWRIPISLGRRKPKDVAIVIVGCGNGGCGVWPVWFDLIQLVYIEVPMQLKGDVATGWSKA